MIYYYYKREYFYEYDILGVLGEKKLNQKWKKEINK